MNKRNRFLKIVLLYIVYNISLKLFFSLFNHLIYIEYPEKIKSVSFIVIKDNILISVLESFFRIVSSDIFWLLPFTIMNIYIFYALIKGLLEGNKNMYQHMSFIILRVYLVWCIIYLCSIGFGFGIEDRSIESLFGGVAAPYGGYTITYLLLGNFIYVLWFVPLWNWRIKNWIIETKG